MNEFQKTGVFAILAVVVGIAAWVTKPTISNQSVIELAVKPGQELFADKFTDPLTAASLKIVKYDETLGSLKEFSVERNKNEGGWVIPSKESYPADATNQMSNAANALIGVKVFAVASTLPNDQSHFGVVEPNPETLKVGDQGVGLLVRMQNSNAEPLASLVIGKGDGKDPKRRYVRVPNTDLIYYVEIDMAPFTTDFSKWIEDDLLKLSSTDLQTIGIRDYTIGRREDGQLTMGKVYDADLSYTTANGSWNVNSIKLYEGRNSTPRVLTESEQLNTTKINEIKNTLDSLKIVDVLRKPKGLAADLHAEKVLLDDKESQLSLFSRGFIPQPGSDASTEILSTNGEMLATLNNGVQYVLRFGNSARESEEPENDGKADSGSTGVNRFLLVSSRLDEEFYPQPVLQKLPETVEEMKAMEEASKAAQKPSTIGGPLAPGEFGIPPGLVPPEIPEGQPPVVAPDLSAPVTPEKSEGGAADEQSMLRAADRSVYVAFQPPTAEPPAAAPTADKEQETPEELKERLEATREQITKENLRRTEERADKIKAARKKVDELNARFAEWYYVISESDYKKLKVSLADLIQPKTATTSPTPAGPASGGQLPPGFNFGN